MANRGELFAEEKQRRVEAFWAERHFFMPLDLSMALFDPIAMDGHYVHMPMRKAVCLLCKWSGKMSISKKPKGRCGAADHFDGRYVMIP